MKKIKRYLMKNLLILALGFCLSSSSNIFALQHATHFCVKPVYTQTVLSLIKRKHPGLTFSTKSCHLGRLWLTEKTYFYKVIGEQGPRADKEKSHLACFHLANHKDFSFMRVYTGLTREQFDLFCGKEINDKH